MQNASAPENHPTREKATRGREREKWGSLQTKPKLLTLHGQLILECEVRIYPLPNQLSTSNGIPSLIELSLLLSSVNCWGYLLQAKENPCRYQFSSRPWPWFRFPTRTSSVARLAFCLVGCTRATLVNCSVLVFVLLYLFCKLWLCQVLIVAGAFLTDVDRFPWKSESEFCVVRATH